MSVLGLALGLELGFGFGFGFGFGSGLGLGLGRGLGLGLELGVGGSSSTYPYIHITINTLQVELKNAWGATDLVIMKCVCSSAGITNTCHTTEESQAIVVTPPTGSLGFIRMLLLVNGAAPELPTPASMAYCTIGMCGAGKRDCRWRCVSECIKELQTVRCIGCSWDLGFLLPIMLGI